VRVENITVGYYDENARAFDARTAARDMTSEYDEYLRRIPKSGRILDVGCGPGRDALAFKTMGYSVTAIDASAVMVALASERLGYPALQIPFDEISYADEFDGIWACASLLHVTKRDMPNVLERLCRALKPGGVLYASFKRGPREEFREGRWFNDYEEDSLRPLFAPDVWNVIRVWPTDEVRPNRRVAWINVLAQKRY
jgi:SAM-dependent methyltransferase